MTVACAEPDVNPDWFASSAELGEHRRAHRICRECPLRADCYQEAVAERLSGMYGGVLMVAGHRKVHGQVVVSKSARNRRIRQDRARATGSVGTDFDLAEAESAALAYGYRWHESAETLRARREVLELMPGSNGAHLGAVS